MPTFSIIGNKISVISNVDYVNYGSANIKFSVNTTLSNIILGFPYNYQLALTNQITSPSNYNIA